MKRSNRLVLLVGLFLAIVAFVGILLLISGDGEGGGGTPEAPTELPTVIAKVDIPLGTPVRADQVDVRNLAVDARDAGAFQDPSQVIGKIVRQRVGAGAQLTGNTFSGGGGQVLDIQCPTTFRCMSVQVDQVSGVGTVIKTGDYVDMVVGFTGDKFPVITVNPADETFTVVSGLNSTSVKILIQGMQVLGTLLPPVAEETGDQQQEEEQGGTTLTGQQQIVILAVTPQQAEIIKFAQLDGSVSLVLRSAEDFIDPVTQEPTTPLADETTGVILKTLVDQFGVLPPEVIESVLPAGATQ